MHYTPDLYRPTITRAGAAKLSESQVAPVVAAARGVRTFVEQQVNDLLDAARKSRKGADAKKARQWLPSDEEDVLLLPWTSATVTKEGHLDPAKASFFQVRPSKPLTLGDSKKPAKYDTFARSQTVLDIHPATPLSWFENAPRVLITEGVIKGDSALTAMLIAGGIDPEALLLTSEPSDDYAAWAAERTAELSELMESVPASRRTLIISIVGVANWEGYGEWGALRLNDKTVYVAFDGDVHENANVHTAATKLFRQIESKRGVPHLLDLGSAVVKQQQAKAGHDLDVKVGLDDYLAFPIGTWKEALELGTTQLPSAPARDVSQLGLPGQVRVTSDGTGVEKYVERDGSGMWSHVDDVGGRVQEIITSRAPTPTEMATGQHEPEADAEAQRLVKMELKWRDQTGAVRAGRVTGPGTMLDTAADRWSKMPGERAAIDASLQASSVWPPKSQMDFLRAIKGTEPKLTNSWDCMGWVPTHSGQPVYLIGRDVLGATKEVEAEVSTSVTESTFPGASNFGVIDKYWELLDEGGIEKYRADVAEAIEKAVTWFLLEPCADKPGMRVWDNAAYGPVALAAMLRPCLPAPWRGGMFIYGPPNMGKSWMASFILGGWNRVPGLWSTNQLPGNAADTQYSMEIAIGRMPIWVSDDMAVAASESAANERTNRLDTIIRQLYSGAARRASGGTGKVRIDPPPRSVFILTAENQFAIPSAGQRVVQMQFRKKITPLGERLEESLKTSTWAPRATASLIRYWMQPGIGGDTWEQKIAQQKHDADRLATQLRKQLEARYGTESSKSKRQGDLYGSLLISLKYLHDMYEWAGGDMESDVAQAIDWTNASARVWDVLPMIADTMSDHADEAVGRRLLRGIKASLASFDSHLLGTVAGQPPYSEAADHAKNEALGWQYQRDQWVGKGKAIGHAGLHQGHMKVVFDRANAFAAAKAKGPMFIAPGASMKTSWQAAEEEGLVQPARRFFNHTDGRTQGPWLGFDEFMSVDDEMIIRELDSEDESELEEVVV